LKFIKKKGGGGGHFVSVGGRRRNVTKKGTSMRPERKREVFSGGGPLPRGRAIPEKKRGKQLMTLI